MTAPRRTRIMELDQHASTAEQPYGIITADCSSPKEIDDGIFVEPLPTAQETYRVGVCVVDTSRLYDNGDVFKQAMTNIEAKYWVLPGGELGYDPMIDPEVIHDLEFTSGNVRDALMVSFLVGKHKPLSEVNVSFGKVEVVENLNYKDFVKKCWDEEGARKFGRAAAFIIQNLKYTSGGDHDVVSAPNNNFGSIYNRLINSSSKETWLRGSRVNEAYMVAANHLIGRLMAEEGRPAIYRVHDPSDETYLEFLPPDMATYSRRPGLHAGLNLNPYCRVTSPLRRLEDFMMSYQLRQRHLKREPTLRDTRDIAAAIQRLNGQVVREFLNGPLRLNKHDTLGRGVIPLGRAACGNTNVVQLHQNTAEADAV